MGLLRRRLSHRASLSNNNNRNGINGGRRRKGGVHVFTKLALILCIYLVGAAYNLSTKPNLRSQLKDKFQSLLKGEKNLIEFLTELSSRQRKEKKKIVDSDSSSDSSQQQQKRKQPRIRIPCGLIIAAATDADKEVLPLTTCIDLLLDDIDNENENNGISFLNEKIFQRYPQFRKYVDNVNSNNIIPSGIFHLRMGSIDATIEVSPDLHIIKHTSTSRNNDDCDLILGKQFWDNHFTEFNDDELYLSTTTSSSSSSSSSDSKTASTPRSRVMVPYIRIRQPLSFDNDNDNSDL
jgi:hypothetical protein